jgi:hypothetical protein
MNEKEEDEDDSKENIEYKDIKKWIVFILVFFSYFFFISGVIYNIIME